MKFTNIPKICTLIFLLIIFTPGSASLRLFTIGDSTMSDYDEQKYSGSNEQRGWAQMLPVFLQNNVQLINAAKSGRSSKSFYYEYWISLRDSLQKGDYVFIQFGHNDEKNDGLNSEGADKDSRGTAAWGQYQEYLAKYVNECRERGAIPILFTSVVRAGFDSDKHLTPTSLHSLHEICGNNTDMNYPMAMRSLAKKMHVPLIDMTRSTQQLVEAYGYNKSKKNIYCRKDDTHLTATGGILFARLAVKELIKNKMLKQYFIY